MKTAATEALYVAIEDLFLEIEIYKINKELIREHDDQLRFPIIFAQVGPSRESIRLDHSGSR